MLRSNRRPRGRRPTVLLIGVTRRMMRMLEGSLSEVADVSAVPFPSEAFERIAGSVTPCLVVVDTTFLREERVRPAMIERFRGRDVVLVFTSEEGGGWVDDLRAGQSWPLADARPEAIAQLLPRRALVLVDA